MNMTLESHSHPVPQFTRLPVRLAFCLKDAVPMSAIEAGHVFLGFSKCGQFLLSYTQVSQVSSFIHWLRLFWGFQDVIMSSFIKITELKHGARIDLRARPPQVKIFS